jgi:hypothetical protein
MNNHLSDLLVSLMTHIIPMQIPSVAFFYGLGLFLIKIITNRGIAKIGRHLATIIAIVFFTGVLKLIDQNNTDWMLDGSLFFYLVIAVISLAGAYVSSYRLVDIKDHEIEDIFSRWQKYQQKKLSAVKDGSVVIEAQSTVAIDSRHQDFYRHELVAKRLPDKDFDYQALSLQELAIKKYFSVRAEGGRVYIIFFSGHAAVESNNFLKVFNTLEECRLAVENNTIQKLHPPGSVLTLEMSALIN